MRVSGVVDLSWNVINGSMADNRASAGRVGTLKHLTLYRANRATRTSLAVSAPRSLGRRSHWAGFQPRSGRRTARCRSRRRRWTGPRCRSRWSLAKLWCQRRPSRRTGSPPRSGARPGGRRAWRRGSPPVCSRLAGPAGSDSGRHSDWSRPDSRTDRISCLEKWLVRVQLAWTLRELWVMIRVKMPRVCVSARHSVPWFRGLKMCPWLVLFLADVQKYVNLRGGGADSVPPASQTTRELLDGFPRKKVIRRAAMWTFWICRKFWFWPKIAKFRYVMNGHCVHVFQQ